MIVHVNGERRQFDHELPLDALLQSLSLPLERIAVELNHQVISKKEWPMTIIKEDDRLEIVHFVGGGSSARQ